LSASGYEAKNQPPLNNVSLQGLIQTLKRQNPNSLFSLPVLGGLSGPVSDDLKMRAVDPILTLDSCVAVSGSREEPGALTALANAFRMRKQETAT